MLPYTGNGDRNADGEYDVAVASERCSERDEKREDGTGEMGMWLLSRVTLGCEVARWMCSGLRYGARGVDVDVDGSM